MINGIINVYKEQGYTSHDVVAKMRGILKQKKIGHTGTLDPDAKGVLPVCLGNGTKLCDMLTDHDKTYEAVLKLGITTDTQDITGNIIQERKVIVTREQAEEVILSFLGEYNQIPPMYSAIKINGKRLYELARAGKEVERKARKVHIHNVTILGYHEEEKEVRMLVDCSKGTYIRTLCHDIGEKLGCGGCMKSLIRTKAGMFTAKNSLTLATIEELLKEGTLEDYIIKTDEMFPDYQKIYVKEEFAKYIYNGNSFYLGQTFDEEKFIADSMYNIQKEGNPVRVYDWQKKFIGIYQYEAEKEIFKPVKMFL